MKNLFLALLMAIGLFSCSAFKTAPKGDLTYCSYTKAGGGSLGKDYCELIADVDSVPKIVVVLNEGNRFDDPVIRRTFEVEKSVVDSLAAMLKEAKVYKLDGYRLEEPISGGHSYRIYQEYSSGDKVDARWYGNKIKNSAISAYDLIEYFFKPWRDRAESEQ